MKIMAEGRHCGVVGLGSQTFTSQWGHHRAFAMLHKAWHVLCVQPASFPPYNLHCTSRYFSHRNLMSWLMFVREISQGGMPNQSGVLVGQDWSSKRYSLVSLLLVHSPRKTFISKKLPNGFLSLHQFLAFSVIWDSCMRAVHCVRKFCFSFVLNRASAGFTLLQISWQDWSKPVETEGMKVKLCSLYSWCCIALGDALPRGASLQPSILPVPPLDSLWIQICP